MHGERTFHDSLVNLSQEGHEKADGIGMYRRISAYLQIEPLPLRGQGKTNRIGN